MPCRRKAIISAAIMGASTTPMVTMITTPKMRSTATRTASSSAKYLSIQRWNTVIIRLLLAPFFNDVSVQATLFFKVNDGVYRHIRKAVKIPHGAGIGCPNFKSLSRRQLVQALFGLEQRQGAGKSGGIDKKIGSFIALTGHSYCRSGFDWHRISANLSVGTITRIMRPTELKWLDRKSVGQTLRNGSLYVCSSTKNMNHPV